MDETLKKKESGKIILSFFKKNIVFFIALAAAALTIIFVPFDNQYISYFDFSTLSCLFCTMAVVCALKNIRFFEFLSQKILKGLGNLRACVVALVFITYFASMALANDMALITFLPLSYYLLKESGQQKHMAFTFIMQNAAANLGGMLTPFGNPQNLYLYSYYQIPTGEFFLIMLPPFAAALIMLGLMCLFVKPIPISSDAPKVQTPPYWRIILYALLFAASILMVFRVFPYYWGLLAVTVCVLLLDYKAVLRVDYGLLFTFAAFFIFSGNLSRIPAVKDAFSSMLSFSPLFVGLASCQVISNVPTAVLLSRFTSNYSQLLVAVNVGGVGTPISSLASLITLSEYRESKVGSVSKYIGLFSAINFSLLIILSVISYLFIAFLY